MGEFGATITFVSNIPGETQTLPTLIYTFTQVPGGDASAMKLTLISDRDRVRRDLRLRGRRSGRQPKGSFAMTLEGRSAGHGLASLRSMRRFATEGGVTAIFGRSGSGKTTLINMIAGLRATRSMGASVLDKEVLLDTARGTDKPAYRRRIGYVFQDGRLFPHLTVRQNLLYGRWFAAG